MPTTNAAQQHSLFINGEFTKSTSGQWIPVYDPSTEEVIAEIPDATTAEVDSAVAAARYAFDEGGWPQTTAQERGRILFRIAEKIRAEAPMLAELESRNCGKPIVESEYDMADAATCFEYYGGLATKISGTVNPVPDNAISLTMKEPVGVAGQIIPWNYPLRHGRLETRPRPCRRLLLRRQARRANPAHRCLSSPAGSANAAFLQASSTSLPATAKTPEPPSSPIPASTRSPSPAAPPSAKSSCAPPPTPSSASPWS